MCDLIINTIKFILIVLIMFCVNYVFVLIMFCVIINPFMRQMNTHA